MPDLALDVGKELPSIGLVPAPVQFLGSKPELDNEVARQVFGFCLTAFFLPEAYEGGLIIAHDDPGVGTADERASVFV